MISCSAFLFLADFGLSSKVFPIRAEYGVVSTQIEPSLDIIISKLLGRNVCYSIPTVDINLFLKYCWTGWMELYKEIPSKSIFKTVYIDYIYLQMIGLFKRPDKIRLRRQTKLFEILYEVSKSCRRYINPLLDHRNYSIQNISQSRIESFATEVSGAMFYKKRKVETKTSTKTLTKTVEELNVIDLSNLKPDEVLRKGITIWFSTGPKKLQNITLDSLNERTISNLENIKMTATNIEKWERALCNYFPKKMDDLKILDNNQTKTALKITKAYSIAFLDWWDKAGIHERENFTMLEDTIELLPNCFDRVFRKRNGNIHFFKNPK